MKLERTSGYEITVCVGKEEFYAGSSPVRPLGRSPILAGGDRAFRVRENELKSASYEDVFLYKYANLEEKHLVTH